MNGQAFHSLLLALALLCGMVARGHAQGTFQNLNFEAANIPNGTQPGFVSTTSALPGWSVFFGSSQQTQITYNDVATGSTWITLIGANDPFGPNCIEGNFGVLLQGGTTATDTSIRQTSLVPILAQSLLFKALAGPGTMLLSLGGQNIPYSALSSGPNYTLYGADISAFAGQTKQLEFSALNQPGGNNNWSIDSIVFSPSVVPEPSSLALGAMGALLLGLRRWLMK